MPIVLKLLGAVQVTNANVALKFATDYTRALLAYLAVEADIPHPRARLAALLWPEEREAAARHNLRQVLFLLKQSLHGMPEHEQVLHITASLVEWRSAAVSVDLRQFQALHTLCKTHTHADVRTCLRCLEHLAQAVALYQGEFLAGLLLKQSQPFEEWAFFLREQTQRQVVEMLTILAAHHLAQGSYAQAEQYATRQVGLEPWHEEGYRQLMQALAAQGQPSAALRQYESCRRTLEQEFGVPPSVETTRLYEQMRAGELPFALLAIQTSQAPAEQKSSPGRLHNLPAYLAPFVGRIEQRQQLHSLVCDPRQRLVTIVGMGGMGKTRLALALMEQLVAESPASFAHGVWFIPLVGMPATVADLPTALAEATLNAVSVITPNQEDLPAGLFYYLAERRLLLIFDNVEHLLLTEASATAVTTFILRLLQAAPHVTLLATSRLPLQLLAEQVIRLDGLPVPTVLMRTEPTDAGGNDDAANYASVRLFVQHAQRTLPGFRLTQDNLALVAEVCALLSGIPLAIELAAALTPHFTLPELVAAIRQNLALLVSKRRDTDARHRNFMAVLESSWQLLAEEEARVLAQCSIFVGPFSRAAAQAITGATPVELMGLLDKSLLQQSAVSIYGLHELLRQFANQQLAALEAHQIDALQARYVGYYLGLFANCNARLRQRDAQAMVAQLRQANENCRRAWQIALERRWVEPMRAAVNGWLRYWEITGGYREGETLIAAALAVLDPIATASTATLQQQGLCANLWLAYAHCLYGQERIQASMAAAEQAMALALTSADAECHAHGLALFANGLGRQNRHTDARPFAERAYQSGVWEAQIHALITLAGCETRVQAHVAVTAQALQIAQQHDDPYLILLCIQEMAGSYENMGYYADSLPYRAQALHLAYEIQDAYHIGETHYCYGLIQAHIGLFETAIEHFAHALRIAQEHGVDWLERRALNRLARSHYCLARIDTAYAFSLQVQAKLRHDAEPNAFFDFTHAQILVELGCWRDAERIYQQVLTLKRTNNAVMATALLPELAELARLTLWQGDPQQALLYIEEILELARIHPHIFTPDLYFNAYAIDVACYEVLHALHDERAQSLLDTSYQRLSAQFEQIADPMLRRSYLENVTANRELHEAYLCAFQPG